MFPKTTPPLDNDLDQQLLVPKLRPKSPSPVLLPMPSSQASPEVSSPQGGLQSDLDVARGRLRSDLQQFQTPPPEPAKGARRVAGTVATIFGSLINPTIGAFGQKLLNPGLDRWGQTRAFYKDQLDADSDQIRGLEAAQRIQDARQAARERNEDRDAVRINQQNREADEQEARLTARGGEFIPNSIQPVNRRLTLLDPNAPPSINNLPTQKTLLIPGVPSENQFNPETGTPYGDSGAVREIRGANGDLRSTLLFPNQGTLQARKLAASKAAADSKRQELQQDWVDVPDSIVAKFPDRYKKGDTAPRAEINEFQKLLATPRTASPEDRYIDEYLGSHPGSTVGQAIANYSALTRAGDQPKQATPAQFRLVDQNKNRGFAKARDAWNKERADIEKQFQYAPTDPAAQQAQNAQKDAAFKAADGRYRDAQRAALESYNSELSAVGGIPTVFDIGWQEDGQPESQPLNGNGGGRGGRSVTGTPVREFPRSRLGEFAKANGITPQQAEQQLQTEGYSVK